MIRLGEFYNARERAAIGSKAVLGVRFVIGAEGGKLGRIARDLESSRRRVELGHYLGVADAESTCSAKNTEERTKQT